MEPSIKLGKKLVNNNSSPYIIAEIGVNHEGSLELAKKLIDLAKEGGADAAKFQTYKANTIASKNSPSYWDLSKESTKSQYELFLKYDSFSEKEYELLFSHCKQSEIEFISTPFDHNSVDFLDNMMPYFKVSSSDITNIPLLNVIAKKNKPIVLSTGASSNSEIEFAINNIKKSGNNQIALLHCILNYPTKNNDANLNMISFMKSHFKSNVIGYSDHTLPDKDMTILTTAYLMGAVIIEKHFTHDKSLPGNDHYHAMDVNDLKVLKTRIKYLDSLRGSSNKKEMIPSENISKLNARRSLVLRNDLKKGQKISSTDLICKRPGNGISPIDFDEVVGLRVLKDLKRDHILNWIDLIGKKNI